MSSEKIQDSMPVDGARRQVALVCRRLGLLHLAFAETLVETLGADEGQRLLGRAIGRYGRWIGEEKRRRAAQQGLEPGPESFYALSDLPDIGMHERIEPVEVAGEQRIRAHGCVMGKLWQERGRGELGRFYCLVDPASSMAFDPGVGVYVDGVFMPRSMGLLMDIVDVEQIEVLRGPQGTLFGKNTVGGAVNLTTTKPGDELEGSVFIQPGNLGTVVTRFTLNVPVDLGWLEDKLFARFSGSTTNTRGYVYDDNPLREEYFSNRDSVGFYGSLRFLPTEDITIDLAGSWSRDHNKGLGGQCVFVASQPTAPTLLPPGFYEDCQESEPFRNNANVAQLNDITSYGTWMTADWDLGGVGFLEDLPLKSPTSWASLKGRSNPCSTGLSHRWIGYWEYERSFEPSRETFMRGR